MHPSNSLSERKLGFLVMLNSYALQNIFSTILCHVSTATGNNEHLHTILMNHLI